MYDLVLNTALIVTKQIKLPLPLRTLWLKPHVRNFHATKFSKSTKAVLGVLQTTRKGNPFFISLLFSSLLISSASLSSSDFFLPFFFAMVLGASKVMQLKNTTPVLSFSYNKFSNSWRFLYLLFSFSFHIALIT